MTRNVPQFHADMSGGLGRRNHGRQIVGPWKRKHQCSGQRLSVFKHHVNCSHAAGCLDG